jgi:DNA-binding XRE family transcriptional regulator
LKSINNFYFLLDRSGQMCQITGIWQWIGRTLGEVFFVSVNRLRDARQRLLLSKAELARRAGISPLTIDRIERGKDCRLETKRKIILALGLRLEDREKIFA